MYGYDVRPTGADNSRQNAVERQNRTIGNGVRALLLGANLEPKFWPYAFRHYIRLKNATVPARHQNVSPLEAATGSKDNFKDLRTFGCRVWVKQTKKRDGKFVSDATKGIFLGYIPNTTKNVVWYDPERETIKLASHVRYDEGMNDLPINEIPPNVQHLQRSEFGGIIPAEDTEIEAAEFEMYDNPFSQTATKVFTKQQAHCPTKRERP